MSISLRGSSGAGADTRRILGSFFAFGAAAAGTLLLQFVAVRLLPLSDVGRLILVYGGLSVVSTVAPLGIPQVLLRRGATDQGVVALRWRAFAMCLLLSVPWVILGSLLSYLFRWPDSTLASAILLGALVALASQLMVASSLLRTLGRPTWGVMAQQGVPLAAAVLMAVARPSDLQGGLAMLFLGHSTLWGLGLVVIERSSRSVSSTQTLHLVDGTSLSLWASSTLAVGFRWLDRLMLPLALPISALAAYQSLYILAGGLEILGLALAYNNVVRYARRGRWDLGALKGAALAGVALAALTFGAGFILAPGLLRVRWTPELLGAFGLILAAGVAKILYADATAGLGGAASPGAIRRFVSRSAPLMLLGAALTLVMGRSFGVIGLATAGAVLWAARTYVASRIGHREFAGGPRG